MSENQVVHDWLLKHKPETANHDAKACSFCSDKASNEEEKVAEEKIFTQEQYEQLLAAAVEKAVAEATTKMDGEVLTLNDQLKALEESVKEKDEKIDELQKANEERDENDRLATLGTERVDLVKAKANFSDEQIQARKDAWAKMSEEDFKAYLDDIELVAKASEKKSGPPPSKFDGTRESAHEGTELEALKALLNGDLASVKE